MAAEHQEKEQEAKKVKVRHDGRYYKTPDYDEPAPSQSLAE